MTKKTILLIALLCFAGLCFGAAVTSSPYTGAGWNTGAPNDEALIGNTYQELQDLRKGVETRINKEHIDLASSSVGGEHMQGSARAFYLATASIPALQPDGTALASTDNGMLWHDTTTDIFYCLDDYSDPTVDGGWVSIGMLLGGVDVGASKFTVASATGNTVCAGTLTVTGESTFNSHINLGAGDDILLSTTSDITISGNTFTVAGATGNTLVAGTLDVSGNIDPTTYETTNGGFLNHDSMTGAADNTVASSDSIAKYATLDAGGVLMHDAEGAFNNADVDSTKTKVYTLYLTGTLDADASTSVAHGITGIDTILSVAVAVYNTTDSAYIVSESFLAADGNRSHSVVYDGTNVIIANVGATSQSQKYRIKIDYIL